MLKHRSTILEHQNDDTWSLSHFFMENAKNSSRFAPFFDRETVATLDGDGRSQVRAWKQALLDSRRGIRRGDFFEISLI
jgi:hypothetical protein